MMISMPNSSQYQSQSHPIETLGGAGAAGAGGPSVHSIVPLRDSHSANAAGATTNPPTVRPVATADTARHLANRMDYPCPDSVVTSTTVILVSAV
jgi:hypothetical protein